jgi:hypothetical protein
MPTMEQVKGKFGLCVALVSFGSFAKLIGDKKITANVEAFADVPEIEFRQLARGINFQHAALLRYNRITKAEKIMFCRRHFGNACCLQPSIIFANHSLPCCY